MGEDSIRSVSGFLGRIGMREVKMGLICPPEVSSCHAAGMAPRSSETYHLFTATRRLGIVASRILVHENMKSPRNYQTSSLGLGSKECGISLWQCNAFQINQFPWIDIGCANITNNDNKNTNCL